MTVDLESLGQSHPDAVNALDKLMHRFSSADLGRTRHFLGAGDLDGFYNELGLSRDEAEHLYASIRTALRSKAHAARLNIADFLPIEEPLLLLRALSDLQPGVRVVADAGLEKNDWRAYFTTSRKKTVPVMLQLEALAQAGTIGTLSRPEHKGASAFCARVTNAQFHDEVRLGQRLQVESNFAQSRGHFDWVTAKGYVDRDEAVSAVLTFKIDESIPSSRVIQQPVKDPSVERHVPDEKETILTRTEVQQLLPTDPNYVMIDCVTELEPGRRAVASLSVSDDDWFFAGHFPGHPVMPGMLQLEALAQTSTVALLSSQVDAFESVECTGVPIASFRHKVEPGDSLTLEAEVISDADSESPSTVVRAWLGETLTAEARLVFQVSRRR